MRAVGEQAAPVVAGGEHRPDLAVSVEGDEVRWDISTDAGPMAEVVVGDFFRLPETLPAQKPV